MLNLFKKKEAMITAPCSGRVMELSKVKDAMFAQKVLGDGIAIDPCDDVIYAPSDGKITMIARTKHAFGMIAFNGAEILVHVGLDTVQLNGVGFETLVHEQQHVKTGTPILKLDLQSMKEQHLDVTIPIIITNGTAMHMEILAGEGEVTCGQELIRTIKQ